MIFAGFSADAIAERIAASQSKWVFTSDEGLRGGKRLPLKNICDNAMNKEICVNVVSKCFVFERTGGKCNWSDSRDVKFGALADSQRPYCPCESMDSEDNLFILYTSGSTGRPKGVVHTVGGYCLYAMEVRYGREWGGGGGRRFWEVKETRKSTYEEGLLTPGVSKFVVEPFPPPPLSSLRIRRARTPSVSRTVTCSPASLTPVG